MCWLQLLAIHINRIAQGLESVEADTDRKDNLECSPACLNTQYLKHRSKALTKEVEILEESKDTKIEDYISSTYPFAMFDIVIAAFQSNATQIAEECSDGNKDKEAPIPPAIKNIAGSKGILPSQMVLQKPVSGKYNRKEKNEFKRVKKHFFLYYYAILWP